MSVSPDDAVANWLAKCKQREVELNKEFVKKAIDTGIGYEIIADIVQYNPQLAVDLMKEKIEREFPT